MAGHQHHRNLRVQALGLLVHFESRHARHLVVENHEVEPLLRRSSTAVSPRFAPFTAYPKACRTFTHRTTTGPASSTMRILVLGGFNLPAPARPRRSGGAR